MKSPKLVASFAFRYEPADLVKGLLANLDGVVDDVFSHDDRGRKEKWIDRDEHVRILLDGARSLKADWILVISPDERLEIGAGEVIRELVNKGEPLAYRFRLREMFTPTAYRVDGIWGTKRRSRLYPLDGRTGRKNLELNIYHLRMIGRENREARARIHSETNTADNRVRGFDYLADERGMVLEEIPPGRGYKPAYDGRHQFSYTEPKGRSQP